jgi:uncharacterized protein (DUF58 family)
MRPTARLAILFAVAAPAAVVLGGVAPALWTLPFDITAVLLAAFALDAVMTRPARALRVTASTAPRAFIGEDVAVAVHIDAAGRAGLVDVILQADGDIDPPLPFRVAVAGDVTFDLMLRPRRRGRVAVLGLALRWLGPLGLNQRLLRVPIGASVDVVPNIRGARTAALHFNDRNAPLGVKLQRDRGAGTEFESLRDMVSGMDRGAIDWKHSARHGRLVGKEFRVERNHPVVLAFDTGHLMSEPIDGVPRLDHAIAAGLLLGWIALRGGDLVGIYGFDASVRHWAPPQRGTGGFARVQAQAATLGYHAEETNFTLALAELTARLKRRSLVVLFTDFVDTVTAELMIESLGQLGGRHVVVFVSLRDPGLQRMVDAVPDHAGALARAVVAGDFLQDRRAVFSRLARLGVRCLDVDRQSISVGLINTYVDIKQRGML